MVDTHEATVFFKKLTDDAILPMRKLVRSAGYDLSTNMSKLIKKGEVVRIGTGVAMNMTSNIRVYARLEPRSGTAVNRNILVIPGIIDNDYVGEIIIVATYLGPADATTVEKGAKLAQIIFHKVTVPNMYVTTHLPETVRGSAGFGSTDLENCPANQEHAAEQGYITWPSHGYCAYREWFVDPPLSTLIQAKERRVLEVLEGAQQEEDAEAPLRIDMDAPYDPADSTTEGEDDDGDNVEEDLKSPRIPTPYSPPTPPSPQPPTPPPQLAPPPPPPAASVLSGPPDIPLSAVMAAHANKDDDADTVDDVFEVWRRMRSGTKLLTKKQQDEYIVIKRGTIKRRLTSLVSPPPTNQQQQQQQPGCSHWT